MLSLYESFDIYPTDAFNLDILDKLKNLGITTWFLKLVASHKDLSEPKSLKLTTSLMPEPMVTQAKST